MSSSLNRYAKSKLLAAGIFILFFLSCDKFEYSPYQTEMITNMPEKLNETNIIKILANPGFSDDTVTIIYSGDSQRFYDELKDLVNRANTLPNVDFLIISGDITEFGLLQEYIWINQELNRLKMPFLCAIGNHDLIANGGQIYERIFGEKNFSFVYKKYKFLFHDTNGREYDFNGNVPNLWWLTERLNDTTPQWFVGISHVPPYDIDFDRKLEYAYKNLFASTPGFILSLHGHLNNDSDLNFYGDSVRYMTSNSVGKRKFTLLKLINGEIIKQVISY